MEWTRRSPGSLWTAPPGTRHSALFAALDRDGTRPAELARRLGVTRQSVHQTLHELVDMGLLKLIADPVDRRATIAQLTPQGREHLRVARRIFRDLERELEDRIGTKNAEALRCSLSLDWGDPGLAGTTG